MKLETADDVQLLVEDMGWATLQVNHVADLLNTMNDDQRKNARQLVNRRIWDETFDDEMAAKAKWSYMMHHQKFAEAIWEWQKRETK